MVEMKIFCIAAVAIFLVLGIIWGRSNFINLATKVGFFALAAWGAYASGMVVML